MISLIITILLVISIIILFFCGPNDRQNSNWLFLAFSAVWVALLLNLAYIIPLAEGYKEYKLVENEDGSVTWKFAKKENK